MRLGNKVTLITGGASGIGRATAVRFAQEGAALVMLIDVNREALRSAQREIRAASKGTRVEAFVGNVASAETWEQAVAAARQDYGHIDVLFNNAGITIQGKSIVDFAEAEWDQVMTSNLRGVFLGTKYVLPLMLERGGSIINNASTYGMRGFPGAPAYTASKGGIISLTRQVAIDYGPHNIRVNCICPGPVLTPLVRKWLQESALSEQQLAYVPLRRAAQPEEIAALVLFLASDEASFVSGAIIPIDGGQTARGRDSFTPGKFV